MAQPLQSERYFQRYFHTKRNFNAKIHLLDTAQDFLDALDVTKGDWAKEESSSWKPTWLFRGQRDYRWCLKPSIWRVANIVGKALSKNEEFLHQRAISSFMRLNKERIIEFYKKLDLKAEDAETYNQVLYYIFYISWFEAIAIAQFGNLADELGFVMPSYREYWKEITKNSLDTDFCENYLSLIETGMTSQVWSQPIVALAQHHGIPTRLLDWTKNPLTAAFFAAENYDLKKSKTKHIAVYAIRDTVPLGYNLERPQVDANSNSFLKAQKGVFTYYNKSDIFFLKNRRYPSHEEIMIEESIDAKRNAQVFLLPSSQLPQLIKSLSLLDITRANLSPTLDNVVNTITLRWKLRYEG